MKSNSLDATFAKKCAKFREGLQWLAAQVFRGLRVVDVADGDG